MVRELSQSSSELVFGFRFDKKKWGYTWRYLYWVRKFTILKYILYEQQWFILDFSKKIKTVLDFNSYILFYKSQIINYLFLVQILKVYIEIIAGIYLIFLWFCKGGLNETVIFHFVGSPANSPYIILSTVTKSCHIERRKTSPIKWQKNISPRTQIFGRTCD